MQRHQAHCLACAADVPEDLRSCPTCGYDLDIHERRRHLFGALGTALSLSVVLAPFGLPLLWKAHLHRLAAAGTVTGRAESSVREDLRTVLGEFVSLKPSDHRSAEHRIGGGSVVSEVRKPPQR